MGEPVPPKVSQTEIADLLRRTRSPFVGERAAAEQEFRDLGHAGINALVDFLEVKSRNWKRRRKLYWTIVTVYSCLAVPLLVYLLARAVAAPSWDAAGPFLGGALGGVLGGGGGGLLGGLSFLLVPPQELIHAANLLSQAEDLRSIRPLIRLLSMRLIDPDVQYAAGAALARLLPRIDETYSDILSREDVELLNKRLLRSQPDKEEELVIAILNALAWTGDAQSLSAIRNFRTRISKRDSRAKASDDPVDLKTFAPHRSEAVLNAIDNAVARIEMRVTAASKSDTLLRASETVQPSSNLLRAAHSAGQDDPAVLLRAGTRESGD